MSISCPLCQSNHVGLYTNQLRFNQKANVLICSRCSLIFIDQKSFVFPDNFYESQYHQTYLTHVDPDVFDPDTYFKKMQEASKPWIKKIKSMLTGHESVLDIGCSTGHLLVGIKDSAGTVYGHELSFKEVDFCQKKLGLDVDNKPLEQRFLPESFDLITLMFVLEHIGNPIYFLTELKKYLKPNGKVIILVPNVCDPLLNIYKIDNFNKFYFCIEHLFYYSPQTLSLLMEKTGFEAGVECIQEYPLTNHLHWIYCQKPRDILSARSNVPYDKLTSSELESELATFWDDTNNRYQKILTLKGYTDRIFCTAKIK